MPRALLWCLSIVAAFPLQLSAATLPMARVPVTASVAALAERLGMDVTHDRGRFAAEIIRRIYSPPASRQIELNLGAAPRGAVEPAPLALVDVPLTPEIWSAAVFKRPVPTDHLLASILGDRRAALLCRGLAAADDETLEFYAAHPALLTYIYEHAPGAFAAFADSLHVSGGRLLVPGGEPAEPLWFSLVRVHPADADAFIRALLFEPEARWAYLLDVLATTSPDARAFALGLWIGDEALRARRFDALGAAVHVSFREWHVEELPFARPLNDLAILLLRVRTGDTGAAAAPSQRRFWSTVLGANASVETPDDTAAPAHTRVDAAWLLQAISGDMYSRGDRLDQFAFGQRVFGSRPDAESDAIASILREMPSRRMLLLTLERIGISAPDVYASALRQARAVQEGGGARFWSVAQQQAALAVLVRMTLTSAIQPRDAESLARSLFAVPVNGGEFRGALADWIQTTLAQHLPSGETWQARVVAGVAGGPTPGERRVEWEGQTYRLDLAYAERKRLEDIHALQGGPDLDVAFDIARLGRSAAKAAASPDAAQPLVVAGQQLLASAGAILARPPATLIMAPGVTIPRDYREWLQRAVEELDRGVRSTDERRIARAADTLIELGDVVLGHALLSFVYAMHIGDPNGPALLGVNVALRHDFGFGRRDSDGRTRGPWAQPRQDFQPGVPWHVAGSLVGLDVALAPLALHRMSMDGLDAPPKLQSIEREAFAVNVALLDARQLREPLRARLIAALERGRARVSRLATDPAELERVKSDLIFDGWRRRELQWGLQNAPASVENLFSLSEVLSLGGVEPAFDAWGASGLLSYGCLCTRLPDPRTWRTLAGRTQYAMMAASTVELNLEMVQRLAVLRLPAALLPSVLTTAMQDFVDRADPADPGDLRALVNFTRTLDSNKVADFVAATATLDGPLFAADAADTSEP